MTPGGPTQRIGVFGGTFDPFHVGHMVAAVDVHHALTLDRVLLMVANVPWQKEGSRSISAADDRYRMVADAVAGIAGLEASRMETDRGGETYTAETLEELAERSPGAELFCIVGGDVAVDLDTWRRADRVRQLATIVVVDRPGWEAAAVGAPWRVEHVAIPMLDVSSTELRARAAAGRPLDGLVPAPAVHWIRQRGLYAGGKAYRGGRAGRDTAMGHSSGTGGDRQGK